MQNIINADYEVVRNEGAQADEFPFAVQLTTHRRDGSTERQNVILTRTHVEAQGLVRGLNAEAMAFLQHQADCAALMGGIH